MATKKRSKSKGKPKFPPFKHPKHSLSNDDSTLFVKFSWNQSCSVAVDKVREYWLNPPAIDVY